MANDISPLVTIKLTQSELELVMSSLYFLTTIKLPIPDEWIKPYISLKKDLYKINDMINEKVKEAENDQKRPKPKQEYIDKITGREGS